MSIAHCRASGSEQNSTASSKGLRLCLQITLPPSGMAPAGLSSQLHWVFGLADVSGVKHATQKTSFSKATRHTDPSS